MSGMDHATKLKPCPFCGGGAYLSDAEAGTGGLSNRARNPRCWQCGVDLGYCDTAAEAIAAWNRRASQAAPAPSAGLREAVQVLDALIAEYHQDAWADVEDGEWTGERPDLYDQGISVPYATLSVIRAAISASPAQDEERTMEDLAEEAVANGISRSSFAQEAEWCHDQASERRAAPTEGEA